MRSPARALERKTAVPCGTTPKTTMSARIPPGDSAVSPPARVTPYFFAKDINPRVNPLFQFGGKSPGRASDRVSPHGGDVAQAASEAPVTDGGWRMRVPSKMDSFQGKVRSH